MQTITTTDTNSDVCIADGSGADPPDPMPDPPGFTVSTVWFGPLVPKGLAWELMAILGAHDGVAVLDWPRDAGHVEQLAQSALPRLLLVDQRSDTPPEAGPLQAWLNLPASQDDIHSRVVDLWQRAAKRRAVAGRPTIEDGGWLRLGDGRVELGPVERRLAQELVAQFEEPIVEETLFSAARYHFPTSMGSLRGHVVRLCQCANRLGLDVVPVGRDAYVMRRCHTVMTERAA